MGLPLHQPGERWQHERKFALIIGFETVSAAAPHSSTPDSAANKALPHSGNHPSGKNDSSYDYGQQSTHDQEVALNGSARRKSNSIQMLAVI
jgi:hypothetical protein